MNYKSESVIQNISHVCTAMLIRRFFVQLQEERRQLETAAMLAAGVSLSTEEDDADMTKIEKVREKREREVGDLREKSLRTREETIRSRESVNSCTAYKVTGNMYAYI